MAVNALYIIAIYNSPTINDADKEKLSTTWAQVYVIYKRVSYAHINNDTVYAREFFGIARVDWTILLNLSWPTNHF